VARACVRAVAGEACPPVLKPAPIEPVRLIPDQTSFAYPDRTTGISRGHAEGDIWDLIATIGHEHFHHQRGDCFSSGSEREMEVRADYVGGKIRDVVRGLGVPANAELIYLSGMKGSRRVLTQQEVEHSYREGLTLRGMESSLAEEAAREISASLAEAKMGIVERTS